MKPSIILYTFMAVLAAMAIRCNTPREEAPGRNKAIPVKAATVTKAGNASVLRYSGTVEASQVIPLTFQTTGTIQKVYVEIGDVVRKGQLLATVENSDLNNLFLAARAKYGQAKDAWERLKSVHESGSLPEIKWVEMETNLEQAKSSLEIARNNLEKCNLRSPANAVVGHRNIEPGQSAVGSSLVPIELVQLETLLVRVAVPENEISRIARGQSSEFTVAALGERKFGGTVTHISPVAEAISRTYTIKISVANTDQALKPGMVCDVSLPLEQQASALLVPYRAVGSDPDGKSYVYVISEDGKRVKKQTIQTGKYLDSNIEVLDGLSQDQKIVVEGKEKLSDNSLISL